MSEMFDPFEGRPIQRRSTQQAELRFSDSIDENLGIIQDLISGMPSGAQQRARSIAMKIQEVIERAKKEAPKDPAVGLGIVWAVHFTAKHMTEDNRGLIQLLT